MFFYDRFFLTFDFLLVHSVNFSLFIQQGLESFYLFLIVFFVRQTFLYKFIRALQPLKNSSIFLHFALHILYSCFGVFQFSFLLKKLLRNSFEIFFVVRSLSHIELKGLSSLLELSLLLNQLKSLRRRLFLSQRSPVRCPTPT